MSYNATTGNYMDDPDNPTNAANIIIKYCIDHADRVVAGVNVVQTLVNAGLVPIFYDGKNCTDAQNLYNEGKFQQRLHDAQDSLRESPLGNSHSEKDKISRDIFNNLPKDTQENLLESLAK